MSGGPRRWTTGPLPDGLLPARADAGFGEPGRPKADGTFAELRRQWSPGFLRSRPDARSGGFYPLRAHATFAGSPQHHGPRSTLARGPETMSGSSGAAYRRQVSGGHAGRRRPLRHRGRRRRDRCAVPARRVRRPSGRGRSSWTRWSRPAADSSGSSGSSPLRRSHGLSSGYRGRRRYDRRRLPLAPWAFRVPQPCQPTSSICHHRTQTNEEGRSTSSGATLFMYVRRCPTLPRGPPRSTIGAEGLNFRVRNGTGCFPYAITAETLLRCHRPAWSSGPAWRPYLGNRTVDAKSKE